MPALVLAWQKIQWQLYGIVSVILCRHPSSSVFVRMSVIWSDVQARAGPGSAEHLSVQRASVLTLLVQ